MSNKIFLLNIFGLITDLKFIRTKIETSTAVKSGIKGPVIRVNGQIITDCKKFFAIFDLID